MNLSVHVGIIVIIHLTYAYSLPLFSGANIATPSFSTLSYLELDLDMTGDSTHLQLTFNPSAPQGYIFYTAGDATSSDFLALTLVDSMLELRYDLGSGVATIQSDVLTLDVWYNVLVTRELRTATMTVNNVEYGPVVSPEGSTQLNVDLRVSIGGLDDFNLLSPLARRDVMGLSGCIADFEVS